MPIKTQDPPPRAREVVARAVASRDTGFATIRAELFSAADAPTVSLSFPHRVAYLPLSGIRRGTRLRDAALASSWRFLVDEEQRLLPADAGDRGERKHVAIAAATATDLDGGNFEFGALNEGNFVSGTVTAIRKAEQLPEVAEGSYEPLLLLVPVLYVAALWLKDLKRDSDLVLTIPPSHAALVPYEKMTAPEFLAVLADLAATVTLDSETN